MVTPDGWELVAQLLAGDLGNFVLRRVADGTESGNASFTWSGSNVTGTRVATSWMVRHRAAAFENVATSEGTGATAALPSVLADGLERVAIAFLAVNGGPAPRPIARKRCGIVVAMLEDCHHRRRKEALEAGPCYVWSKPELLVAQLRDQLGTSKNH